MVRLFKLVVRRQAINHAVWLPEPPTDGSQTPGYYQFLQQFVSAVRNAENALGVPAASQLSTTFMDVSWYVCFAFNNMSFSPQIANRQWENNAGNPAYVSNGGNAYDSHLYYSFGAVSTFF